MEQKSNNRNDNSFVIQTWGEYEFKLNPGSKSTKPYVHFQFQNPNTGIAERVRKFQGLKRGMPLASLKREAKEMVSDLIDMLDGGWNPIQGTFNESTITPLSSIQECMDYWLKEREKMVERKAMKHKTYLSNTYLMRYFKEWLTNNQFLFRKPKSFTKIDINNFLQITAHNRKWNKVSYNCYRIDLGTFFGFLKTLKIVTDNPVIESEKKNTKKDASRFVIYEEDELSNVVKLLSEDRAFFELYVATKLIFFLNVRPIEITKIQVYNIDFEKKILFLEGFKTKNEDDAKWELTDELYSLLKDLVNDSPEDYFVFANRNTPKPIQAHKDFLGQRWRAFRKKYKISNHLKLYALKHSADWYDLDDGMSLLAISERNRHGHPNTTVTYFEQRLNKRVIKPSKSTRF